MLRAERSDGRTDGVPENDATPPGNVAPQQDVLTNLADDLD